MTGMPLLFISHGAPTIALEEDEFTRAVRSYGETLADAKAIVIVSAHWQTRGEMRVNAVAGPEPIYDFGGFAPEMYTLRYDAPGDPQLARRIVHLLQRASVETSLEEARGWDHGVWVPLRHLLPAANIPIVELSLPHPSTPELLMRAGSALAPLREEGVVIAGSGGIVHNFSTIRFGDKEGAPDAWAAEFDDWVVSRVAVHDLATLADYRRVAPHAALAAPTPEHFDPIFVVAGAARADDILQPIHRGFDYGNLSMRAFALASADA